MNKLINKNYIKAFSVLISVLLLFSGIISVSAENGNKMTANYSQSILHGKKAVFCGYSTDLYKFKFNGGSPNFWSMLTDGIIADSSGSSQLNQIYSSGTGKYSTNGTNFVFIYDLEKYYDLASVALYSFHSDNKNETVMEWDVYASDNKTDLLTFSKMANGKKGFDDPLDLQIPVYFRHVRYLAFVMRCENALLKVAETEAFGVLSKDQGTMAENYTYDITDNSVKVKADSASFSSDLSVKTLIDEAGADEGFLSGLGYFYKIHKVFNVTTSGTELGSGTKYTVKLPIPNALRKKTELSVAQKNDNETVLLNADIDGGYATFTTYSLGEFALVEPNYEAPAQPNTEETVSSEITESDTSSIISSSPDTVKKDKPEKSGTKPAEDINDNNIMVWIIVAAILLVVAAAATIILIKQKNKH